MVGHGIVALQAQKTGSELRGQGPVQGNAIATATTIGIVGIDINIDVNRPTATASGGGSKRGNSRHSSNNDRRKNNIGNRSGRQGARTAEKMRRTGVSVLQQDRGSHPAHRADPTPGRSRQESGRTGPLPDQKGTKTGPETKTGTKTKGAPGFAGGRIDRSAGATPDPPEFHPGHGRPGLRRPLPDGTKGYGAGAKTTASPHGTERGEETYQAAKGGKTPQQAPQGLQPHRKLHGCHPRGALFRQERVPSLPPHQDRPQCPAAQHYWRGCRMQRPECGLCHLRGRSQGHSKVQAPDAGSNEMERPGRLRRRRGRRERGGRSKRHGDGQQRGANYWPGRLANRQNNQEEKTQI
mmetsp:Transcript_1642/g.3651  ORF Transcript_1642/g.3651 Transcript_1642/m.3651 type:complete len:352 (-) Transcript_1642:782-1837(-)